MKRIFILLLTTATLGVIFSFNSCQQGCVNNVLLETTTMDIQVNSNNLGVPSNEPKNSFDTIRNHFKPFYNYPEFRQFGFRMQPPSVSFFNSAYAADDCPVREQYVSRMDPSKTRLSINLEYDATSFGLGVLPADTNLLGIDAIRDPYLLLVLDNPFLNAGAPGPVTILGDFFEPINDRWVTFQFYFEEIDGTPFFDSVAAYVDLVF